MFIVFSILFFLCFPTLSYSQPVNNVLIRDLSGDVQTRWVNSSTWEPSTGGLLLPEKSFIRLNSPDSLATLSFPDGSVLRLLGIGVFFLDQISNPQQNTFNHKIYILTGRWFFESPTNYPSRLIINSEVTTSIVERGTGGGTFYKGTNEFVLLKGRGIISYRQTNINAIVLDERQYINFNIFDGFFKPKLVNASLLERYGVYEQGTSDSSNEQDEPLSLFTYSFNPEFSREVNGTIQDSEIDINQLFILENLQFEKRADQLQVLTRRTPREQPKEEIFQAEVTPPIIPKQLLEPVDVDSFQITQRVKPPRETAKKDPPKKRPQITRPTAPKTKRPPKTKPKITNATESVTEDVNIEDLLEELENSVEPEDTRSRRRTRKRIDIEESDIPEPEPEPEPEPTPPPAPPLRVRRAVPKPEPVIEEYEEEEEEEIDPLDAYRSLNDQLGNNNIREFDFSNLEDVLDSNLSSIFFH